MTFLLFFYVQHSSVSVSHLQIIHRKFLLFLEQIWRVQKVKVPFAGSIISKLLSSKREKNSFFILWEEQQMRNSRLCLRKVVFVPQASCIFSHNLVWLISAYIHNLKRHTKCIQIFNMYFNYTNYIFCRYFLLYTKRLIYVN